MRRTRRSVPGAALSVVGAGALVVSLFLVWSHQLGPAETRAFSGAVLFGVPANPNAWQVYAVSGEVLALLALGLAASSIWGGPVLRLIALAATGVGLAFVIHAASTAPTNGLLLSHGTASAARYVTDHARTGPGEAVALIALIVAVIGLLVGFIPPRPASRP